jgi:hypothetical protein
MKNSKNFFSFFKKTIKYLLFSLEALYLISICLFNLVEVVRSPYGEDLFNVIGISSDFPGNYVRLFFFLIMPFIAFFHTCYYLLQTKQWKILFVFIVSSSMLITTFISEFFVIPFE